MIKSDALAILEELNQMIQSMDDDELLNYMLNSSESFRKEIDNLKLLLYEEVGMGHKNTKRYDSTEDTKNHIKRVRFYIEGCIRELNKRKAFHDFDKIHNPIEKALFDEFTPKLKDCTFGSEEYQSHLKSLKPALEIHYRNNKHHPEHFINGIKGMNIIDLLEMICDWKASSERHADGDILKSIEINQNRFGYSDELKNILINTAMFLKNHE